ncbi:hypothetical protein BSL78_19000 [Apostichopus japonicus]|uniref:Coiled-coil SMC6 And NSE5 INteracting (CANIN) domain-containing protein n=1 Tax=Stichopus japonicus TaxID=307972 RepID=A0A2G8K820_STIJA|nr:hypothetical protein BSL78_19000 [Apostichopus japonicus]
MDQKKDQLGGSVQMVPTIIQSTGHRGPPAISRRADSENLIVVPLASQNQIQEKRPMPFNNAPAASAGHGVKPLKTINITSCHNDNPPTQSHVAVGSSRKPAEENVHASKRAAQQLPSPRSRTHISPDIHPKSQHSVSSVTTVSDPNHKGLSVVPTRCSPKSSVQDKEKKRETPTVVTLKNALSDLSVAIKLYTKTKDGKKDSVPTKHSGVPKETHQSVDKEVKSGVRITESSRTVSSTNDMGRKPTVNSDTDHHLLKADRLQPLVPGSMPAGSKKVPILGLHPLQQVTNTSPYKSPIVQPNVRRKLMVMSNTDRHPLKADRLLQPEIPASMPAGSKMIPILGPHPQVTIPSPSKSPKVQPDVGRKPVVKSDANHHLLKTDRLLQPVVNEAMLAGSKKIPILGPHPLQQVTIPSPSKSPKVQPDVGRKPMVKSDAKNLKTDSLLQPVVHEAVLARSRQMPLLGSHPLQQVTIPSPSKSPKVQPDVGRKPVVKSDTTHHLLNTDSLLQPVVHEAMLAGSKQMPLLGSHPLQAQVTIPSPSKSPQGTRSIARDPRLSSKMYSSVLADKQPSTIPAVGIEDVGHSSTSSNQRGSSSSHSRAQIVTVPLPKRSSPQQRRGPDSARFVSKGSNYHLIGSGEYMNSKQTIEKKGEVMMYQQSSCPRKVGIAGSTGLLSVSENSGATSLHGVPPTHVGAPVKNVSGLKHIGGHKLSPLSEVGQVETSKQLEADNNQVSKVADSPTKGKKGEPHRENSTSPQSTASKPSSKGQRTKFQKSRTSVHLKKQPSFSELMQIASKNAGKGKPDSSENLKDSRKRRHSDGQINRYKIPEVSPTKMFPEVSVLLKRQKLGKLPESNEMPDKCEAICSGDDQRDNSAVTEKTINTLESMDNRANASGAISGDKIQLSSESKTEVKTPPVPDLPISSNSIPPSNNIVTSPAREVSASNSERIVPIGSSDVIRALNRGSATAEVRDDCTRNRRNPKTAEYSSIRCQTKSEGITSRTLDKEKEDPPRMKTCKVEIKRQRARGDVSSNGVEEEMAEEKMEEGGEDSSGDDDDDDSFLMDTPSALIQDAAALLDTPMPVTPLKGSTSDFTFHSSPTVKLPIIVTKPKEMKVDYTLDRMLHMKNDRELKYGDIATIRSKLMDTVSKGGIAKLASEKVTGNDKDVDMTEIAPCLAQVMSQTERIPNSPPGEEIFSREKVCQLFTPSQCLVVQNWDINSSVAVGDLLCEATADEVEEIIKTGCLDCFYTRSQIPTEMMRWMFILMSIHPSSMESQMLYNTIWGQLNKADLILDELGFPWRPTLEDIITVLLNYGGDLAGLISVSDYEVNNTSRGEKSESVESRDTYWKDEEVYGMLLESHIGLVVKIITQAIITYINLKDCSGYRTEELQCMLIVMFRIALDKNILGYAGLQNLVFPEKGLRNTTDSKELDIKVSSLIPILHCCKPSLETDYYQLHSIILLLDFSIGNEILKTSEKMGLEQMIRKLREMVGEIRDNAHSMLKSQVKSLIVRTATKLSFMTQAMVTKEASLFSFLRTENGESLGEGYEELPEHHISSQTDAASLPSDDDDSTVEMEEEEDAPSVEEDGGSNEVEREKATTGDAADLETGRDTIQNRETLNVSKVKSGVEVIETPTSKPSDSCQTSMSVDRFKGDINNSEGPNDKQRAEPKDNSKETAEIVFVAEERHLEERCHVSLQPSLPLMRIKTERVKVNRVKIEPPDSVIRDQAKGHRNM